MDPTKKKLRMAALGPAGGMEDELSTLQAQVDAMGGRTPLPGSGGPAVPSLPTARRPIPEDDSNLPPTPSDAEIQQLSEMFNRMKKPSPQPSGEYDPNNPPLPQRVRPKVTEPTHPDIEVRNEAQQLDQPYVLATERVTLPDGTPAISIRRVVKS